ncbi:MAG: type I restriction-modification system subunit M [Candidatus Accumulibacter sp.]|jgi:type I restriction enzyme M protein|nr:type I restriction-modification system subunit M [Accumulibacter sp.]
MAIKKSDLYASLWASCDLLRGGMDASQYKDYVLVLLFIKYVSDKYAGQPYAPITIPAGASFANMTALKGKPDIGDQINKKIIGPLADKNHLSDMPDFNDTGKLGSGRDMVDRLTALIAVFENPDLDFSQNRADGDDILGDAYEYLMRHFATESGKSKGQFYTPAEVSRIMARIVGIDKTPTSSLTTVYDPTCGSGSLLLKVGDAAPTPVSLYGQEKDGVTSGLARMNMILHGKPTAVIHQGNTLADPKFKDENSQLLKTFDFVVANPPFSDKRWSMGLDPLHDDYGRFETFGVPPTKQGDYAYLLHIVRSLKSTGKGACILPHGVLFRGNAEAEIRKNLIRHGYIKGIIGLPANLFYGTGIPACIVVIDKENAPARKGVFMVDASAGFIKEGPKNRLRERDIHRIVDVFTRMDESDSRYARRVNVKEIEQNDYNLNLPRYIDSSEAEDAQDIGGHLQGGIPVADVKALKAYWTICPALKNALFAPLRDGYVRLTIDKAAIKASILEHRQFAAFIEKLEAHFADWRGQAVTRLKALKPGFYPKELIVEIADGLLRHFKDTQLIDAYAVYQHLMDYWATTLQDDAYLLAADGWAVQTTRIVDGRQKDKGWTCDLIPKPYIVARYFAAEQSALDDVSAMLETASSALAELEEEHSGEDMAFSGYDKITAAAVKGRIKEIGQDPDDADELAVLKEWQVLADAETYAKKKEKELDAALDAAAYAKYPKLSITEIKTLVVEDKWLAALSAAVMGEVERVSQILAARVRELAERYETPLPVCVKEVAALSTKVDKHLRKMGAV